MSARRQGRGGGGGEGGSHPNSVGLAQPHGIGQLDLDLSAVERAVDPHHLQQAIIQTGGSTGPNDTGQDKHRRNVKGLTLAQIAPFLFDSRRYDLITSSSIQL